MRPVSTRGHEHELINVVVGLAFLAFVVYNALAQAGPETRWMAGAAAGLVAVGGVVWLIARMRRDFKRLEQPAQQEPEVRIRRGSSVRRRVAAAERPIDRGVSLAEPAGTEADDESLSLTR